MKSSVKRWNDLVIELKLKEKIIQKLTSDLDLRVERFGRMSTSLKSNLIPSSILGILKKEEEEKGMRTNWRKDFKINYQRSALDWFELEQNGKKMEANWVIVLNNF